MPCHQLPITSDQIARGRKQKNKTLHGTHVLVNKGMRTAGPLKNAPAVLGKRHAKPKKCLNHSYNRPRYDPQALTYTTKISPQALHATMQPFFPCPRQHAYVLPLAYSQCCLCTSNLLKNRKGYNWGAQSHSCLPLMCTKFYHTTALWSHFQTQYL